MALLATSIVFVAVLGYGTPAYETNDDVIMMRIASGLLTGEPSPRLVHTSILIGEFLAALYSAAPSIDWYSWYLVGVHFVAATCLLRLLLEQQRPVIACVAFALLFVLFEARFLLQLQFTTTAAVAAASGVVLLLSPGGASGRTRRLLLTSGGVLLVVAAMIREQAFYMTVMLSLPLFLAQMLERQGRIRCAWFAVTVLLGFGAVGYDHYVSSNDAKWRSFDQRYADIKIIVDRDILVFEGERQALFDDVGWSANDLMLLRSRFFDDPHLVSAEQLRRVAEAAFSKQWRRDDWLAYLVAYTGEIPIHIGLTLLIMLFCVIGTGRERRLRAATMGLGLLLMAALMFAYLALFMKLADRVALSALYVVNVVLFTNCLQPDRPQAGSLAARDTLFVLRYAIRVRMPWARPGELGTKGPRSLRGRLRITPRGLVLALLAAGFVWAGAAHADRLWELNERNMRRHEAYDRLTTLMFTDFRRAGDTVKFVTWGNAFPYEWCPPFSGGHKVLRPRFILWGWTTPSPHHDRALQANEIESTVDALLTDPNVYLVCWPYQKELFEQYVRERLGAVDIVFTQQVAYDFVIGSSAGRLVRAVPILVVKPKIESAEKKDASGVAQARVFDVRANHIENNHGQHDSDEAATNTRRESPIDRSSLDGGFRSLSAYGASNLGGSGLHRADLGHLIVDNSA